MVKDVNETLKYYTTVLGFTLVDTNPEKGVLEWGFVKKGNVGLMFQQEASMKKEYKELTMYEPGGALTLYVRVQGIEEWYREIKDKVRVIKPLNKTFYGAMEFALTDINGFILTFSEMTGSQN